MPGDLTRRQLLGSTALVGVVGLGLGGNHVFRSARAVPPSVPEDELENNGWVKDYQPPDDSGSQQSGTQQTNGTQSGSGEEDDGPILTEKRSMGPVDATIKGYVVEYRDQGMVRSVDNTQVEIEYLGGTDTERLGDHASGAYGQRLAVFAATRLNISPHVDDIPGNPGVAEIMDQVDEQARSQFEDQLANADLENVKLVAQDELDIDTPSGARNYTYAAEYPFGGTDVEIYGEQITVPPGVISVAGYLAMWHDGDSVMIAAGAHPDENYSDTVTQDIQGREATADLQLDFAPTQKRQEILGYMEQVA